ncbi:protocadherin-10-like [Sinocyclocheilus anshuiensis]|uniref:Protocadherin-10-like n=1 Tax=Sinocyclocheilus anshuiensis TaxID=1608454 RepID=A0A671PAW5_9TELE|nr:PREDICTED: protocadherin-10-like [Sinocyclocheilus anshuiensis]
MEQRRRSHQLELNAKLAFIVVSLLFGRAVWAQIQYSISEEQKDGAAVGNVAKDLGIDRRTLKERGFRIVSTSGESMFSVNQNDGVLYVNGKIDREEVCERSTPCLINLKIALENPLEIHYVTIEILDVNDHSPLFSENEKRLEIWESALPGARYPLQAARDPDSGSNSVQTYKLGHNDHFRLEIKDREDVKIPILILHKPLDREVTKNIKLELTALDGGRPPKSGSIEIFIDVLDINDNVPIFTKETYTVVLSENAPVGTTIVQVNATDLDEGQNGQVVYALGNNVDDNLHELFQVNSVTGEIIVTGLLDFEVKDIYEIDIQASDKGTVPLATDKSVIIKIVDVNDNAPEMEVTSFSSAIPEDSRPGTTVALISVTDLDSGRNGKISCSVSDKIPFKLMPSSHDNIYSLVTSGLLDRESKFQYDIRLVANDAGEPSLSSVKSISVLISDVNDNCPEFSFSPYAYYVMENNVPGKILFSVSATDKDSNENAIISYHIWRENNEENKYTSFININSENGEIYALKSFDFETVKMFQFQVVTGHKLRRDSVSQHPVQIWRQTVHVSSTQNEYRLYYSPWQ